MRQPRGHSSLNHLISAIVARRGTAGNGQAARTRATAESSPPPPPAGDELDGATGTNPLGLGLLRASFTISAGALLAVGLALVTLDVLSQLLLIAVAAVIAIGLEPLVDALVRMGVRRRYAVALIAIASSGLLIAFLAAAIPPLQSEATQLIKHAPGYLNQLQDRHTQIGKLNNRFHIEAKLRSAANAQLSLNSFGGLLSAGRTVASYTFQLIVVIALVFYFLADFPQIKRAFYHAVPLRSRPRVELLGDQIIARTGGYLLGNLLTSAIATVCQFLVLRALGVPFAFLLAVFVGVFDLIPIVGSTAAMAVVAIVALATVSTTAAVINLAFAIAYRLFEDYFLSPRILKRTVDVHPAVTIIAILLGGALLGVEGALLAVPVAAAIQLILTEVVYRNADANGPP